MSIDNQDSPVGDNIVLGSPGGQCPVCVSSLGSDAAGQEIIAAGLYSLQGSRGQQSIAAVQIHLYAGFEGNVFQFNGNSVFQDSVIMSNDGALDAAAIGEHRAGQVCPIFGIQREGLRIQFVSIDNIGTIRKCVRVR